MKRNKVLLELIVHDLAAIHAASLDLEAGLRQLSERTAPHDLRPIIELVEHINLVGFTPILALVRENGGSLPPETNVPSIMLEVLGEGRRADGAREQRISVASALSIARRAARSMEISCSSTAETADRLGLTDLSALLRAWSREWIGLEVTLNSAASRCTGEVSPRVPAPPARQMRKVSPSYLPVAPAFASA